MPDDKKSKDLKDLRDWDETFSKIRAKSDSSRKPTGPERLPSSEELETEWEKKIKSGDNDFIASKESKKRADSLEDVFKQLKEAETPMMKKSEGGKKRLDRIGGAIKGEVPTIGERELTGERLSGLYRLYPMGQIPPLNLLSKMLFNISGESLENDLKRSKIPLYPDEYASFSVAMGFIVSIILFIAVFLLTFSLPLTLSAIVMPLITFILSLLIISLFAVNLPSIQLKSSSKDVDKQLPFALRHMSALLSAGISIFDSMASVSKADYGLLSTELDKVIWDVKSGENFSEALEDASNRIGSTSFTRVTIHIRRALQMGGDVANIISQIADDLTFEMRMKISDFVEKLNAFAIVYLIGGIVGPVVIAVFAVVGSARPLQDVGGGGGMLDITMLTFMVLLMFPLIMILITYVVKLMEPKV